MSKDELTAYLQYVLITKYSLQDLTSADLAAKEIADKLSSPKKGKKLLRFIGGVAEAAANIFIKNKLSKI